MTPKTETPKTETNEQLRAQAAVLLSQARSQAADLDRALQTLRGGGAAYSELSGADAQLHGVISALESALQGPASALRTMDLQAIRSMVQSGSVTALVSQASAQASAQAAARIVPAAAAETRAETQSVERDVFDRKIFDRYLHFTSKEDEDEYRKRETDAKRYIDAQLAKKTPEGDLNAGGGMLGQMLDANAHGADKSPDWRPRWDALVDKTERQHAAMRAAGQSTAEFDKNLDAATRRFLKERKGMSNAEIDAKLAGGKDPLEVVKPYLGGDKASQELVRTARDSVSQPTVQVTTTAISKAPVASATVDDISANLTAAGVQMASDAPVDRDGHGLPQQARDKAAAALTVPI